MDLGENIKKYRKQKGLTQKDLASKVGVTASTITKYEKGDLEPNLDIIKKIAKALDISYIEIIDDEYQDADEREIIDTLRKIVGADMYDSIQLQQKRRLNEFKRYMKKLTPRDLGININIDSLSDTEIELLYNAFKNNMKLNIKAILYDNKNK